MDHQLQSWVHFLLAVLWVNHQLMEFLQAHYIRHFLLRNRLTVSKPRNMTWRLGPKICCVEFPWKKTISQETESMGHAKLGSLESNGQRIWDLNIKNDHKLFGLKSKLPWGKLINFIDRGFRFRWKEWINKVNILRDDGPKKLFGEINRSLL